MPQTTYAGLNIHITLHQWNKKNTYHLSQENKCKHCGADIKRMLNKESCIYNHMEDSVTVWCESQNECKNKESCPYKHVEDQMQIGTGEPTITGLTIRNSFQTSTQASDPLV